MIAEILSTGDEVLLGDITDTNSRFLCRRLKDAGIAVSRITAVGDDLSKISSVLKAIGARVDICLVTGGLGPTCDDLTAQACAVAAGKDIELNLHALSSMKSYFKKKGYPFSKANEKQAMLPLDARVIENDWGTAPGFEMKIAQCRFFFMPGVPLEMQQMFKMVIRPDLRKMTGDSGQIKIERLMVFGLAESMVGSKLEKFALKFPGFVLGFRARFPMIEVKIMASHASDQEMAAPRDWVMAQLGRKVISTEGLTLAQETGRLLAEKGQTLSIAESCTGGLIANLITDVAGASDYFLFSAITYANTAKMDILKVSPSTLEAHGAVHEQTAVEMAQGARKAGKSDWAVSTTGIAGPGGGSDEKPVGTVCIGVAGPDGASGRRFVLNTGDRAKNKLLFAATALELLRRELSQD
ncbi:MAG: CinA family nicotinamide mononucleotide deamidase-related protein [Desulfobacter sp.]|nr:MAG: CinA family nicotinamide mononucleotide deamidase-related protein [Desulfobacter sp.]